MKNIIATVAVLLSAILPGTANAQTWSDPSGRFTLDLEIQNWRAETRSQNEHSYFAITSTAAAERRTYLRCDFEKDGPLAVPAGLTQAQANRLPERYDADRVRQIMPDARDVKVSHSVVDGVAIADFTVSRPDSQGGTYQHWRTFALLTDQGIFAHRIICGGELPITSQDTAEIDAVLNTLRFSAGPHP